MLWRALGHSDANGAWVAPVSFLEAQKLPDEMLNFFLKMDDLMERAKQKEAQKKMKKTGRKHG